MHNLQYMCGNVMERERACSIKIKSTTTVSATRNRFCAISIFILDF